MLQYKGFKYRLYPNKSQATLFDKTIGSARFVFNFFVSKQKDKDAYWYIAEEMVQNGQLPKNNWKGEFFHKTESIKALPELKEHYPFLKEVDSIALQKSVENVDDAYSRYYNKQNDAPRFKSKKNKLQSYTTKMVNNNIKIQNNYVKLPKVGWVKFAKSREIEGRILSATIRRNPSGKYFISIKTEVNIEPLPKTGKEVGMDMGLKYFAVLSNEDDPIRNPKWFYKLEEKLAKAQRVLSRRSQGSTNWYKQKKKVAKIHEDIVNARTDYLGKISFNLVKNHDLIALEDLKVANMVKNHHLAKAITEVSWAEFRAMLEYKAKWYGKKVVAVNPQYTSQTCNQCGHVSNKNRKTQADFECVSCGHKDNADRNASKNILTLALKQVTVAC